MAFLVRSRISTSLCAMCASALFLCVYDHLVLPFTRLYVHLIMLGYCASVASSSSSDSGAYSHSFFQLTFGCRGCFFLLYSSERKFWFFSLFHSNKTKFFLFLVQKKRRSKDDIKNYEIYKSSRKWQAHIVFDTHATRRAMPFLWLVFCQRHRNADLATYT